MPLRLIPLLFLAVPILEIVVFILVGHLIGLWPTLGLVLLSAIVGTLLLRQQGLGTLARISAETQAGRVPGRELVHGVMILVAGVLLIVPGFVTDTIGLLLFVPKVRDAGWRFLKSRITLVAASASRGWRPGGGGGGAPRGRPDVVDLSGEDFQRRPNPHSPWRGSGADDEPPTRTLH